MNMVASLKIIFNGFARVNIRLLFEHNESEALSFEVEMVGL